MIGIIGAMNIETEGLISRMQGAKTRTISGINYVSGQLCGKEAVVATCGIGKVAAAMCAEGMILCYHPSLIMNTGVAGSLSPSLKTGDVVVSTALVQHDMDTSGLGDPVGLISGLGMVEIPADMDAMELMLLCCKELGIPAEYGLIATGDQFICTNEAKNRIVRSFGALACEMEGGSIAQICCSNNIPFVVTRAISDGADEGSQMDYPSFCKLAAERSVAAVSLFLQRWRMKEKQ